MRSALGLLIFLSVVRVQAQMTFVPPDLDASRARILVVIHGCLQSAESMALGTGFNQIAQKNNLVVIYPQVPEGSNGLGCWNWYLPENQGPSAGQIRLIKDQITQVQAQLGVQSRPVWLAGISSGGAMVSGLIACFPKDFIAAAIHSGPSYGVARSADEANRVLRFGPGAASTGLPCQPQDFTGRIFVIQGDADQVVNPKNAERIFMDFAPQTRTQTFPEQTAGGLKWTKTDFLGSGGELRGRLVVVQKLEHAWSGFQRNQRFQLTTKIPFFSERGPSATDLMWEFLENQPVQPVVSP